MARTYSETHDEAERATLQSRIALYARVALWLAIATDVLNMVMIPVSSWLSTGALLDRSMTVVLAIMWLAARGQPRSFRFLRLLDAVGFGLIALSMSVMSRFMAPLLLLDYALERSPSTFAVADGFSGQFLICGGAILFMLRAAIVPSPPRLTLLVTGLFGGAFVFVPMMVRPAWEGSIYLGLPANTGGELLSWGVWWLIVTAVCTVTSAVIYGLRKDVRAAQRLGQYTLVEKLGEGGMGAVYRASHARLRRPTAIKLLPVERLSERAVARFENEVQLTAELTHPNTITVFDYGRTDDGVFYYAMEYLDGANLAEVVAASGAMPPERAMHILLQAAGALEEAHRVGLIHRDIKPANIMLARQGVDPDAVKLVDFGLVRPVNRDNTGDLTVDGAIVGTPSYMAPEAILDPNGAGPASDLYSLAAVGYFLITGDHVFSGDSVVEICSHHLHSEPTPPSARSNHPVPAELDELLLECLAKKPEQRPASASELMQRLRNVPIDATWDVTVAERWWAQHGNDVRGPRSAVTMGHAHLTVAEAS